MWTELDTEHSFSIWYGWAPRRDLPDMAFSVEAEVYVATYAIYSDPADDARYTQWVHRRTAELAAHGTGVYLGDTAARKQFRDGRPVLPDGDFIAGENYTRRVTRWLQRRLQENCDQRTLSRDSNR